MPWRPALRAWCACVCTERGAVTGDLIAVAIAADDGYSANNNAVVQLRIDHMVDVVGGHGLGRRGAGRLGRSKARCRCARTGGKRPRAPRSTSILHAAGSLRSAAIHNGAACTLLSAQRARCALPAMARNAQLFVDYSAEFAEPGNYDVTFTAAAPGDTAPDNDTLNRAVVVRPYNDIAVAGSLEMAGLFGGQTREKTFTVTTDRRALASARFVAGHVFRA